MGARRAGAVWILAGLLAAAWAASPCEAKGGRKSKIKSLPPEEAYAVALQRIDKGKYFSARTMLQELLPRIPPEDRDLLPRVQLSLADAFFLDGGFSNYGEALNTYRNFLTYFPQHERAPYAQLMIGESLYRQAPAPDRDQTSTINAIEELRKVETMWPESPHAGRAREVMDLCDNRLAEKERLVGRFYQRRKSWLASIDRYRTVVESYPRFPGMSEVLLEMGRCLLAMNRREEAQEAFARLAQREGSGRLVREAEKALRDYDRRREKEGAKLYGDLAAEEDRDKKEKPRP